MYVLKPHIVYYWHAELGADGKDYRADFVHAPFPEILSSRVPLRARGPRCSGGAIRVSSPGRAFEYSPHRNHEAVS